jgi:diaminopimelate epimerase
MRVWERGVGETLASGTGSTAAAYASVVTGRVSPPVEVTVLGGVLTIEIVDDEAWMIGPGTKVYEGTLAR